ncbi:MAG: hypothetical protein NC489_15815 [Ruminococcus flavefaciens]|nr:hypothetical protein [Ruminococcus flavefaciens]
MSNKKFRIDCYSLFLLSVFTAITIFSTITGNDYWWHVKVGEWIADNNAVPTTTIFNWVDSTKEWTAHEWLFELIIYRLSQLTGLKGIYFITKFLNISAAAVFLKVTEKYRDNNRIFYTIFTAFAMYHISTQFTPRPQIFSVFFIYAVIKILSDYENNINVNSTGFLPLISMLWSNIHGGFALLSYLFPTLMIVSHLFDFRIGRLRAERWSKQKLMKLSGITLLSIAGMTVNPVGLKVLVYPFIHFGEKVQADFIQEWRVPTAHSTADILIYFVFIFLTAAGMIMSKKDIKLSHFIFCIVLVLLTFRSVRFSAVLALCSPYFAFPYSDSFALKKSTVKSTLCIIECCVFFGIAFFQCISNIRKDGAELITTTVPDRAIELINEYQPERMFNSYDVSHGLIYNGIDVFVDARADCYVTEDNGILPDMLNLEAWNIKYDNSLSKAETPQEIIDYYNFDSYLLCNKSPLYYQLSENNDIELIEEISLDEENNLYFFVKK